MLSLVGEEGDQRRSVRFRVILSAKLMTTTSEHNVTLRDISATGALAEGAQVPPSGKDVMLKRGALDVLARVVWSDGVRCGLEFDEPISEADLLMHMNTQPERPSLPPQVRPRRPSLRPEPLTAEEMEWVREWAQPTGRSALRG
jgi:hypothetical protein